MHTALELFVLVFFFFNIQREASKVFPWKGCFPAVQDKAGWITKPVSVLFTFYFCSSLRCEER